MVSIKPKINKKLNSLTIIFLLFNLSIFAQKQQNTENQFKWPKNYKVAVCLTYDDGLDCHLDNAMPALDSFNFKGTFFCTGYSSSLQNRMGEWENLSKNGHELGNHSLFHPCDGNKFDWVKPEYNLNSYTFEQLKNELFTANSLLMALDGKKERTFAYTCSDYMINELSFVDSIRHLFVAARNNGEIPKNMKDVDIYFAPSWGVIDPSGTDMIEYVKEALQKETLAVFMFHNVGGGYLNVSNEAHFELLNFLNENRDIIWVDTFINIMEYVEKEQDRLYLN